MEATSPTDATQIRAYYEQSWSAFRKFWSNPQNLALHFGYWDEHTHDHAESLLNMNQQLATRARVKAGDRILDTGCGVGGTVFWLTTHYPVQVFGINLVAAQLDWAQTFARARGLENRVIFLQQDFLHTSFASNSFDVVWAQESACHARDK
ncbi:MAG: methyltransferase domain-containing protein, partial [Chloroflexi bacterium]|nr:methyltransferase domain-containing protein [Chloroflexota bacterium]